MHCIMKEIDQTSVSLHAITYSFRASVWQEVQDDRHCHLSEVSQFYRGKLYAFEPIC